MSLSSYMRGLTLALRQKDTRRTVAVVAGVGGLFSLAVGGAYMGGVSAQASTVRTQAERISSAGADGYSPESMAQAAGGLDASAMAIANRHDPYATDGAALRDRQAELLAARLETFEKPSAVSAFRMTGARDQSRDLECLTQAVYYEARGEGRDGMKAVAQVVLNRARHPSFPKTVCGVVFQGSNRSTGCQFSFTCNGAMRAPVNQSAWNRARDVASSALAGNAFTPVGSATHFHTTAVSPSWRNRLVRVSHIGDHVFYRFGGRNGSSSALSSEIQASAAVPHVMKASDSPATSTGPRPYLVAANDTPVTATLPASKASVSDTVTPVSAPVQNGGTSVQARPAAAEA